MMIMHYLNGNNCLQPVDPLHRIFMVVMLYPPGYTPLFNPNQWYSVIGTYDGTTGKIYVNCELNWHVLKGVQLLH